MTPAKKAFIVEKLGSEPVELSSFEKFYRYVDGDLSGANLLGFDFKGIDLSKYNTAGAIIPSEILSKYGLYNNSYYNQQIKPLPPALPEPTLPPSAAALLPRKEDLVPLNISNFPIYYITDVHLDQKIQKKFPLMAIEAEVIAYIQSIVSDMLDPVQDCYYLLVGGDVSSSFSISTEFYKALVRAWERKGGWRASIVAILGNHELWVPDCSPEETVSTYKEIFSKLGITFLENSVAVLGSYGLANKIMLQEDVLAAPTEILKEECQDASFVVLGGIGYSGLNPNFNAEAGLYRNAVSSIQEDLSRSQMFEAVYQKVLSALPFKDVVCLTHTPKEDWTTTPHNPKWIYVNGHTHINHWEINESRTVYADNQIGYCGKIGLKFFTKSASYDIFCDKPDGIYQIDGMQYKAFYRGLRLSMTFNRTDGEIYMVKRTSVYCFFFRRKGTLFLLDGGRISKAQHPSLEYYFKNLSCFADVIKTKMERYNKELRNISSFVQSFGGYGYTHGCIVDIDFYSHIYLDPTSGEITLYWASSMKERFVYANLEHLLKKCCPQLYGKYRKVLAAVPNSLVPFQKSSILKRETLETDMMMYKYSRLISCLQFTTRANIVRTWSDDLLAIDTPPLPAKITDCS